MSDRRKILLVSPHPVQHETETLKALAAYPGVDLTVAYCALPDARIWKGPEYITKAAFDPSPPAGYPWMHVPNRSPVPGLGKFWGLFNPGLGPLIRRGQFAACILYGYSYASSWVTILAAWRSGTPLLLTTDATYIESPDGSRWKVPLKRRIVPAIYKMADMMLVPSSAGREWLRSLGIEDRRIALTPYVVENERVAATAAASDRAAMRSEWKIPQDARVVVFVGKFIPRKLPEDALRAFAAAEIAGSYLVMVGQGPMEHALRLESARLGISDRVRFVGLVPYASLPVVYTAADVLVVPSSHEPWSLPVNEAMVCGRPVITSDRVGAGRDLVREGENGGVYPCGNIPAFAAKLRSVLGDRETLQRMGIAARRRMETWSSRENVAAVIAAVDSASELKRRSATG